MSIAAARARRLQFSHGSLLTARDLRDDALTETLHRRLHLSAVHGAWGVGLGFEVRLHAEGVLIGPGVAYDYHGREIVSSRTVLLESPLPRGPGRRGGIFEIVIRYRDTLAVDGCPDSGDSAHEERPEWRWVQAESTTREPPLAPGVRLGEEIPLARYIALPRRPPRLDLSLRRSLRKRFRVAGGRTQGRGTQRSQRWPHTWSLTVDTSASGFRTTPIYLADVTSGDREYIWGQAPSVLRETAGPFVAIRRPTEKSFVVDVRFAPARASTVPDPGELVVSWTGAEPLPDECAPTIDPSRPLRVAGATGGGPDGREP